VTTITPEFPCVLIPFARNYEFYGRSGILSTLISTLHGPLTDGDSNMHNNRSRLKAFGICGPGGIGKSQVAAEFAYRALQDRLFDAIFWIRANESGSLFGDIQKVATKLGLMNEEPSVRLHAKVLSRLLSWLSRPQKPARDARQLETATWLIVFDDVQSADTLRNVLPTGNGSILITSRDPNIVQSFTQSEKHWLSLPPLTDVDATRFLLKETKRDISPAEWASAADVARVLGYYPFAIHHMASVISNQDLSFPTFRRQYEVAKDRSRLFSSQFGQRNAGPEYHHTMATVWKLDDLREGVCLLDVISLLDSEGIPEIILQQNSACEGWDEYPTPDNFVSARLELSRTSLITRDRDTEVIKCYTIVQDAVRANMDDARFTDIYRHVSCMLSAAWRYEDRFGFGDANARWDGPNGCDVLFSHVLQLRNHFSRFNTNAVLTDESLQLYRLTLDAAWFSIMQSKFTETTPLLDMAEMIHEGIQVESGADPKVREEFERQERIYHHHRGTLALHTNVPTESLHQLKIFVEMTKAKFGDCPDGKDQSMGVGWNELGNAHLQNDDIEQAEACFKKSILALRNIDGAGEIVVSMPLINLAFALWLSGRLEEAASTFEQAYNERVKHHSKSDNTSFT
jgi:hypothetical protein